MGDVIHLKDHREGKKKEADKVLDAYSRKPEFMIMPGPPNDFGKFTEVYKEMERALQELCGLPESLIYPEQV